MDKTLNKDDMPGILFWKKDKDSIYVEGNSTCAKAFGFGKNKDLVGVSDYDIPCKVRELAAIFCEWDRQVMDAKKEMRFLEIIECSGGKWGLYFVTKAPWFGNEGDIVGTTACSIEISPAYAQANTVLMHSFPLGRDKNKSDIDLQLTQRQSQCLLHLSKGLTAKAIAKKLEISHRTVEEYLNQIKVKWNCRTKTELIELAFEMGLIGIIPRLNFTAQRSILLN